MIKFDKDEFLKPEIYSTNDERETRCNVTKEIVDDVKQLQQENQKYKEVIDKVSSQIKLYGKYNGEKCTRGFSMMTADFNKLLDILKEVE